MSVKRYKYIPRTYTVEGEYGGYFDRADDGDLVTYADYQALQHRAERAEAELRELLNACDQVLITYANTSLHSNDMNRFLKDIGFTPAVAKARKALEDANG